MEVATSAGATSPDPAQRREGDLLRHHSIGAVRIAFRDRRDEGGVRGVARVLVGPTRGPDQLDQPFPEHRDELFEQGGEHRVPGGSDHGGVQGDVPVDELLVGLARRAGTPFECRFEYRDVGVGVALGIRWRVEGREVWGVGLDTSVSTATVRAAMSALNQRINQAG